MHWQQAIQAWQTWLKSGQTPDTTLRLRYYQLRRFAHDHPRIAPWCIDADHLATWLAGHNWSAETRKSFQSALKSFYGWAHLHRHVDADPTVTLRPVKMQKVRARPTPEPIVDAALDRAEPRVRLMILLASRLGMRRGEIAQMHADDVQDDFFGASLLVHGKGGKERIIPLADDLAAAIRLAAGPDGWVFPGRTDGHLSPGHVGKLVADALGEPGWTCHSLRHRFATTSYAGTRDLLSVQELLGHSSPVTTRRYILPDQSALRAALQAAA